MLDIGSLAKARLRKRQVHANRVDLHVRGQFSPPLLPLLGLEIAHGCIERVDDVEQSHAAGGISQADRLDCLKGRVEPLEREWRCWFARVQLPAEHGQLRIELKGFAPTFLHLDVSGHALSVTQGYSGPGRNNPDATSPARPGAGPAWTGRNSRTRAFPHLERSCSGRWRGSHQAGTDRG